ncbi:MULTISPECIES: hypothetical protein [unclassified Streptomyces]|uniref:hypothetical protein n=1 Tax=unclassified Streptomyces TaxID=2593676 RepID=UPI000DF023A4|nr:hypothetical protein [Streptomyces sp. Go-475]AXE86008.1 hypothetical protein C1703_13430 [Streptomyces sp. Go-475]
MTHMKRTTTVLCSLALSAAVLGGTATAAEANVHHQRDHSDSRECDKHDSLGLTLLGIPLLGFFFPGKC